MLCNLQDAVSKTRILCNLQGTGMLQKNALWGLDGPGEAPPLETSSCRIGFSILWGPVWAGGCEDA